MVLLLLAVLGVGMAAGAALVIVGTVALGPFFWVPYVFVYAALRASGVQFRRRAIS